ncbi:MAG: ABC transporter ATP-binding protein [Clostridiales bacterium]|nr:ABC transporter ATP-binding protein [Clostridiales bacterium]
MKKKKIGILKYLKKYKCKILIYLITMVLYNGLNIFTTLKLADFITQISALNYSQAILAGAFAVTSALVGRISYYISCHIFMVVRSNIAYDIQLDLTRQFFKIKTQTFGSVKSGDFINRVCYDPENAVELLDGVIDDFAMLLSFMVTTIYILFLNIWVGLVTVGFLIILFLLETKKVKLRNKNIKLAKTEKDKMLGLVNEIVKSERDIKSLNLDDNLALEAEKCCSGYKKISKRKSLADTFFWNFRQFLVVIMVAVVSLVSIFLLKDGKLALSSFLYVLMNRSSISEVVWIVGNIASNFSEAKIAINRMFEILDEEKYPTEVFGDKYLNNCNGVIEFKNVDFSYIEGDTKTQVLNNLSFEIKPNTTVAFVGKSGSGKTTILNLLSKLTECQEGSINIDGNDIKTLSKDFLRENISMVNQFPYIFDNSIRNNLLMVKPDAKEEELIKACKDACIWDFVSSQEKGLDTNVGESGIKLSGGQKQRLAIARALLRKTKIILFDESTSALDNFAQAEIKKSIDALSENSTVVIVAHRLSTIKNSDKIYFLEQGKICGEGTFEELFNNNEKFKEMFLVENI